MTLVFSILITALAVVIFIPAIVLLAETISAVIFKPAPASSLDRTLAGTIAVLVPAHNESSGIKTTLDNVRSQLRVQDRLIVVADNCSDDTDVVAKNSGAEVIRRDDLEHRGKGYAIAFGLDYLAASPPSVVIVVDADCCFKEGSIMSLADNCLAANRPAQALNIMTAPDGEQARFAIAEFAWIIKNKVRPLGLHALGLPCQLSGTGMAFPWSTIRAIELASANIVEDLKLGLDLAQNGSAPIFCPEALVTSTFPLSEDGVLSQRQRWEHGTLAMILGLAPRLAFEAIKQANARLLVLVIDMVVPPLVLQAGLLIAGLVVAWAAFAVFGTSTLPGWILVAGCLAFFIAIALSWANFGSKVLPLRLWPKLILHLGSKIGVYRGVLGRRQRNWVRTDRGSGKKED